MSVAMTGQNEYGSVEHGEEEEDMMHHHEEGYENNIEDSQGHH